MAPDQWATFGASGVAVVGAVGGWLRFVRPKVRAFQAKTDAALTSVIGHDEIRDPATGRVIAPARPGIGVWMANTDDTLATTAAQLGVLTETVAKIADSHRRLDEHDRLIAENSREIRGVKADLKAARMERVAGHIESAAAWNAVEAISKNGDQEVDPK